MLNSSQMNWLILHWERNQKTSISPWNSRTKWDSWKKEQVNHGLCKDSNDWEEHCSEILEVNHTLNRVQLKKDTFKTPFELWYGYKPNVSYLKVFSSKCYILKESRKGKFDAKGNEGIFFGYSFKSKAYKYLNLSTHKAIKSAHVKVDEFVEKIE